MISLNNDVDWEDGRNNTPGIQQNIYMALKRDIATIPKPIITDPLLIGDQNASKLVTITDNIVMNSYKQFRKLYSTLEAGELRSALQGERDGKSFKAELETFMPGSKAEFFGFVSLIKNSTLLALIPDMDDQTYMLGDEKFGLQLINFQWGTGKGPSDRKGGTLTFDFNSNVPLYIFEGQVDLKGSGYESGEANDTQDIYFLD